ncbi:hypothetical protein [Mangrovicoccus sp. HB161399]|uniref:hypothetical protein n=1 Tax=Mangrovicoccus sp. HB161399 TaxID=2720392 RepID=UPI001555640C|nr:hypothetical protein [Mangrovicoccus sp. HB161399]
MRICMILSLPLALAAGTAAATCSEGRAGQAYQLGESLARQGVPTSARSEVEPSYATCFAIGYREGTLQRLLRTSQPSPPASALPQRPRSS